MLIPMPSQAPSVAATTADESKGIDTATVIGGAAVGVVGGAAVIAGVAQLLSNLRPPRVQQQNQRRQEDRDRDKEPPEEELRARAPSPSSPDDVEKLRVQGRDESTDLPPPPGVGADAALFAFRPEDVAEIREILAAHGAVYEIIRAPQ